MYSDNLSSFTSLHLIPNLRDKIYHSSRDIIESTTRLDYISTLKLIEANYLPVTRIVADRLVCSATRMSLSPLHLSERCHQGILGHHQVWVPFSVFFSFLPSLFIKLSDFRPLHSLAGGRQVWRHHHLKSHPLQWDRRV